ncbi:conserved hypothetical protein [Talaromyces stipitatus ATCC 10500]|uniref:Rhodopsin domain-containing protein n=1 Tax=Talaromyces stipitatus (strain ATCC 10500 / CBS 375.48 / QM 6759 / NRRL 1006) TaxID=441959 RepID=B8LTZ1_TALSN|nr:uncharacterized protein TSTA_072130 [Talaromyces stipitatus ATCC 10500]EED23821.1 conserved hypothetical protein [Talaromyces stipitatus ATCC 10500]
MADLSNVALAPNPNGSPPNFVNPPSLESTVLAVGVVFIAISGTLILIRLATNYKYTGKLTIDDCEGLSNIPSCELLISFVVMISDSQSNTSHERRRREAYLGCSCQYSNQIIHQGKMPKQFKKDGVIDLKKRQFVQQMLIAPTLWATKASVLALYLRNFRIIQWMRVSCWILLVVLFLFYGSNIAIAAVYCIPRNGEAWDSTAFERCASPITSTVVIGVFAVVADLIIFMMPLPIIFRLRLTQQKKIGLGIVFSVGLLTVITSIVSLVFRVRVFLGHDPIWAGITLAITT